MKGTNRGAGPSPGRQFISLTDLPVTPFRTPRRMAFAVLVGLPASLSAQAPAPPGRLVARDALPDDTTQHVAAYFPSTHDTTRAAPVLFVLDPRGRGLLALQLFAGAAERHGWLVVSSYNSASDQKVDPNVDAMNAMLAWAQAHARVD